MSGPKTAQDRVAEELQEWEAQYRSIFEATTDGLAITDLDGVIVEVNPAYCAMRGYGRQELIGRPVHDLIHPEDRHRFTEYTQVIRAGGTYQGQVRLLRKDGTVIHSEVHGGGFTFMGKPHALAVLRDITERVRAEEQRREREAQYRSIFQATTDALGIANMDGIIVEANPAYCSMFGYTYDELIGMPFTALIHPDYVNGAIKGVSDVLAGGSFPQAHMLCLRKDGTVFHSEGHATAFIYQGQPHALRVTRDITERVQAEEQLREKEAHYRGIFEATTDGLAIFDLDGLIAEANSAYCTMVGYAYEELIGNPYSVLFHPESLEVANQAFATALAGEVAHVQAVFQRPDGTTFIAGGVARAFHYRGKQHVIAAIRDVSELVQAYELLEQRVEERTRELSAVLEVSHNVASTLELEPLLGLVLDQLKLVVDYTGAAIFIVEEEQVRVLDYRGPLPQERILNLRIPLNQALGYQAVSRQKGPVIVDDRWSANPLAEVVGDLRTYFKGMVKYANSLLLVPLLGKDRVFGVLRIDHVEERAYADRDAMLTMAFASQAAVAIENARLYARAQDAAALEERHRLARELHDSVTQALYGVTMYAEAAASLLEAGEQKTATTYLREVRDTAQDALREMRLLIFELRPPVLQQEGLVAALQARLAAVESRVAGLSTHLDVQEELHLPESVEEALYGIALETLNNVFKHAKAQKVILSLRQEEQTVTMEITDDGAGFDQTAVQNQGGLGLQGMAERAAQVGGNLTVWSAPGQGTAVRVEVRA